MLRLASFGSVSSGTLRTEDLLDALSSELDRLIKRQPRSFKRMPARKLINEARRVDPDHEHASELVDEMIDALSEFAPAYAYFGAHPGDGADFGFWLSDDAIEHSFDGMRVADTSEVPRSWRGEVLHVNDHGNMTLYVANGRGSLKEVWSLV